MLLDTPLCDFGWQAPEFSLKDAKGVSFSLSEQQSQQGFLIMFICNHCPYVQGIAKRLADDTDSLMNEGFVVAAIMSNDYQSFAADSPENMLRFSEQHKFNFPYLVDEDQSVGKSYGAVCTPDFFGFNTRRQLQYRGRLDDAGMGGSANADRSTELLDAMRLIANTGSGPKDQTASMGCSIKWV